MGGFGGTERWGPGFVRLLLVLLLCGCLAHDLPIASAQAAKPPLRQASAIAYDGAGNLYIADAAGHQVWEATLGGALLLIAGTGAQGFAGDGGQAVSAQLNQPQGLTFGPDGTLYIADTGNNRVRAVTMSGTISTFAGSGVAGSGGDGGRAVAAQLRRPTALSADGSGSLFLCDTGNHRVRKIAAGVIATVAGTGGQGFSGDGGPAAMAQMDSPEGVVATADGKLFIADTHNQRVRVVDGAENMSTFAGSGQAGFAGDGGAATDASLFVPTGLAVDAAGDLLIADEGNERIRSVNAEGIISTLAGSGVEGMSVDAAGALAAGLRSPRAVAVSSFGLPVFADRLNETIRELTKPGALFQPAALAASRSTGVSTAVPQGTAYGQNETATVTASGLVNTPAGQIQVAEGSTSLSGADLVDGAAQVSVSGLSAGIHHLTAIYQGDGLNPGASAGFDVSVTAAVVTATASSSQVAYGAPLPRLSGVVSGVLAQDQNAVVANFGIAAAGLPPVGTYPITATLSGPMSGNYTVSMGPASGSLQVLRAGTSSALGNVGQDYSGMPLALSATVVPATAGQPTGTVQFLDGSTVVATAALNYGSATAVYLNPAVGVRMLSVQYLGDGNFLPSSSAAVSAPVLALPDFTLATAEAPAASTAAGGVATYSVLVSSISEPFTGVVSLSATGLPAGASVSFSPPQVVPGGNSATVDVSVQTVASAAASARDKPPGDGSKELAFAAGLLGFAGLPSRRRRFVLCSFVGSLLLLGGCGARSVSEGTGGVLAQTYSLQVTGTGTNLAGRVVTHSTGLTLTVQQ